MSKRFLETTTELPSTPAPQGRERRQYYRLDSVLPIAFQLSSGETRVWSAEVLQAYTQDVSEGGLCLQIFWLAPEHLRALETAGVRIQISIHLPPFRQPIRAIAHLAWMESTGDASKAGYRLGLSFEEIAPADRRRLLNYARRMRWLPRLVTVSLVMLMATVGSLSWNARANAQARRTLTLQVHDFASREQSLRRRLAAFDIERKQLEQSLREATQRAAAASEPAAPAVQVALAVTPPPPAPTLSPAAAQLALDDLARRDAALKRELDALTATKAAANAELLRNLYSWLRVHQYPTTGLLISYEGDSSLEDWAFTYDQALMAQCFLLFDDTNAARKLLEFFATRAERTDGGIVNAYDAVSGKVREFAVHAGPNLWIGIAALQYTHMTGDPRFLPLAKQIAAWIEQLQRQDPEGGIRGGPRVTWYSTEHNLDAYAFFSMLAEQTGDDRYRQDAQRVLGWLKRHAHGQAAGQINRGRGDATIATDTFAWSIAALGPSALGQIDMDADKILAFAEEHCGVATTVTRPDRTRLTVDGFDFSKPKHLARGGIISSEWTGQMVVAMKLMERYHGSRGDAARAAAYATKASHYEDELAKLAISSPCPLGHAGWALPYATQGNVDTGHGWRTAQGATTGSTSGTVYAIFARLGFNPLQLDNHVERPTTTHGLAASAAH